MNEPLWKVFRGDCLEYLSRDFIEEDIHLTFLDPPYLQGKEYRFFDDKQPAVKYWSWMKEILRRTYDLTADGGAVYFMQREKNAEEVLKVVRDTGWTFQNLIVWKKKTSAVPGRFRFGKQYQIIVFGTKGKKPRIFNRLRVDLPLLPKHKYRRKDGVYLTDIWDDIRELTSGYFAGDEAIRDGEGNRIHKQQSPVTLVLRIVLSSTMPGDTVLDPLAGSGTTLVVANQLERKSIGMEIDPNYVELMKKRLKFLSPSDNVFGEYEYYRYTSNLRKIWPREGAIEQKKLT